MTSIANRTCSFVFLRNLKHVSDSFSIACVRSCSALDSALESVELAALDFLELDRNPAFVKGEDKDISGCFWDAIVILSMIAVVS